MSDKQKSTPDKAADIQRPEQAAATATVTIRLPVELVSRVDAWAGENGVTTRADAIAVLTEIGLIANEGRDVASSLRARAAALAGEQIDRMADATATAEERANRKSNLTDGPSAFRGIRRDRPEPSDEQ